MTTINQQYNSIAHQKPSNTLSLHPSGLKMWTDWCSDFWFIYFKHIFDCLRWARKIKSTGSQSSISWRYGQRLAIETILEYLIAREVMAVWKGSAQSKDQRPGGRAQVECHRMRGSGQSDQNLINSPKRGEVSIDLPWEWSEGPARRQ